MAHLDLHRLLKQKSENVTNKLDRLWKLYWHVDYQPPAKALGLERKISGDVHSVLGQPDGKWIIRGAMREVGGIHRNSIARLNADGSLDK